MRLNETKMQIKMGEQEMNIRMLVEYPDRQFLVSRQERAVLRW